jgi:hypothetical protein
MPLILGGQSAIAAGYSIDNSCRFDPGDTDTLDLTFGTPTDVDKWTISFWIKRSGVADANYIPISGGAGSNWTDIYFAGWDFRFADYQGSYTGVLNTNAFYRDPSAWYHFVAVWDSGNGVAGDRMKAYVNGTQLTSFSATTDPSSGQDSVFNSAVIHHIGVDQATNGYWDGFMAEIVLCDGQAYAASDFGEFNEDSPTIWQPKDPSGLTFGDNGYWLDFEDSAALGNDVSGNNNDWTVNNLDATNQASDTPTNNFCTMNPLDNYYAGATLSKGNNYMVMSTSRYAYITGTMGLSAGKWYYETFVRTSVDVDNYLLIGVSPYVVEATGSELGSNDQLGQDLGYYGYTGGYRRNNVNTSYGDTFGLNLIGTYIDVDNAKIYWAKDGVIQNSGTGVDLTALASTPTGHWLPAISQYGSGATYEVNFGNPTYTLTSAVADANGYGSFEYSPNDLGSASFDGSAKDFLAICTKNLGSDGG